MDNTEIKDLVKQFELIGEIGQPLTSSINDEMCWPSCAECSGTCSICVGEV